MSRKLSAARREQLEKQLDDLRIQYRELRTKELHSRGKQRQQNHLASMEVGQRIDVILYRLSEDNSYR